MEIRKLAEELSIQLKYFKELAACLELETKELSDINIEAMADLNKQKEDIAGRIEAHTEPLRKAMRDVVLQQGLDSEITLGELAAVLKKRGNLEISRVYGELKRLADRNRQLLTINKEIAERFAESVGSTIELLTRVVSQSSLYGSTGGYQQRPAGSVLINREA